MLLAIAPLVAAAYFASPPVAGPPLARIKASCYSAGGPKTDCTMLIAKSIIANSKACLQTSENEHADGGSSDPRDDYDGCVTNFCYQQCASNRGCSDFCTQKAQSLYGRLASAPVLLQISEVVNAGAETRAAAWLWLRVHAWDTQPSSDDLGDLKTTDPNAYAMVRALLAKQQMGVLNFQHPSAGFADTTPHLSAEGAASLARMEASVAKKRAPVEAAAAPTRQESNALYPEAGTSHHNWLNWKSDNTDDQILAGLGADSSDSTGSLLAESSVPVSSPVSALQDDPAPLAPSVNIAGMQIPKLNWGSNTHYDHVRAPKAKLAAIADAKPQFMTRQTHDYNAPGGIDFSEFIPSAEQKPQAPPKAALVKTDAILSGLDFKNDLPAMAPAKKAAPTQPPVENALTDFDFNAPVAEKVASAAQTNTYLGKVDLTPVAQTQDDHQNAYFKMMGMDAPVKTDASLLSRHRQNLAHQPANGYLRSISFDNTRKATSVMGAFEYDLDH